MNDIIGAGAPPVTQEAMNMAMMKHGKPVQCSKEGCGGTTFLPAIQIMELSAIASPNGQASIGQAQVMVCTGCNTMLNPEGPNAN